MCRNALGWLTYEYLIEFIQNIAIKYKYTQKKTGICPRRGHDENNNSQRHLVSVLRHSCHRPDCQSSSSLDTKNLKIQLILYFPRRTAQIFKCARVYVHCGTYEIDFVPRGWQLPGKVGLVGLRLNNYRLRFKYFSSIFHLWFKVIQDRLRKISFSCHPLVSCFLFPYVQYIV